MIKVTVKLFASFREITGLEHTAIEVAPGTTVAQLWDTFVREHPRLMPLSRSAGMALNGRYAQANASLSEGDIVAFLPPVSGG